VGDPDSGNLLVQGDNLGALKALLPYYAGKVKCIYIDPPYNTGNEGWIYNDNVNSPEINAWLGKVVGGDLEDLSRHDKWLCMMYPRLALLREFLSEDGIIAVSVDENEYRHLALLMDEIYGASNRLETLVWKKSYGGGSKSKHIVNLHEYIEIFSKRIENIPVLSLPPDEKALKYYKHRDDQFEERGPYRLQPLATNSMDERPNLRYAIYYKGEEIWPEKQWQWSKDRTETALARGEILIAKKKGKWSVSYKQYLRSPEGEERTSKAYSIVDGIYTQQGTNEIKALFGDGKAFSFPKPSKLVRLLVQLMSGKNAMILDSFAGSGTTAHAVLAQNKADSGNRRFILVEMEPKICREVTAERIKRVIEGYGDQPPLGGGFRYCTLGEPLFDETGAIRETVKFSELAAHVFLMETGSPLPRKATGRTPLLGVYNRRAIYLLFNGVLGDKRPQGGNVLTREVLASLPHHDGPKVVYGESCRLGEMRLRQETIIFKQVPYDVQVR